MDINLTHSSPNPGNDDTSIISEDITVTDADIEELENSLPSAKRIRITTANELRLQEAGKRLLQHPCAVIATISLKNKIDREAANFLVEECLFIFTEHLFDERFDLEPEGYIKHVPDTINLEFIGRLLRYDINPDVYFKNITIPELWKSYLCPNGLRLLKTMKFYHKVLNVTISPEEHLNSASKFK